MAVYKEIEPKEEAVLSIWNQWECFGDFFGCYVSCQVSPGRYGVSERFHSVDQEHEFNVEWTFLIESPIDPRDPGEILRDTCGCEHNQRTLEIRVQGDALAFDKDRLETVADADVALCFKNASSVNTHNWVLVEAGTKDAVAADGTAAGPTNDWLPVNDSRVIASTVLIGPGESVLVTFKAPTPGIYQFVCTFPGHNFTMFGDFVVTG